MLRQGKVVMVEATASTKERKETLLRQGETKVVRVGRKGATMEEPIAWLKDARHREKSTTMEGAST